VLAGLGCGGAEEGLSGELSCELAASHLRLVAVQLWKVAANGMHEHPCGWAPESLPRCLVFSLKRVTSLLLPFFFSFLTSPFLPPQLSHFVVLRNHIRAVESLAQSQMVLAALLTPTE